MAFFYAIRPDGVHERDGWDYLEATNRYDEGNELPASFKGVSGGPAWGLKIAKDKATGQLILKDSSLIGIAISQIQITKKELKVRAHFIRSIYDLGWRNLI